MKSGEERKRIGHSPRTAEESHAMQAAPMLTALALGTDPHRPDPADLGAAVEARPCACRAAWPAGGPTPTAPASGWSPTTAKR